LLERLQEVERQLTALLERPGWRTAWVARRPPVTHRAWLQVDGSTRVYLHRMFPMQDWTAWPHHHPWPFAARILRGGYYMQRLLEGRLVEGLDVRGSYEMTDPNEAHSIHVGEETWSVIVTGAPYRRSVSRWRPEAPMPALTPNDCAALFDGFSGLVGLQTHSLPTRAQAREALGGL
jgi:hypothetical protein